MWVRISSGTENGTPYRHSGAVVDVGQDLKVET